MEKRNLPNGTAVLVLGILSIVAVLGVYGCGNGTATTEQKTDSTVAPAADTTAVDTTALRINSESLFMTRMQYMF